MNIFPLFGLLAGIGAYIVAKKMRDKWWERYGEALKRFNEKHPDA